MKIDIYGDGVGYVDGKVSSIKICEANLNEANRIKFISDLVRITRGHGAEYHPITGYKTLLTEAEPQADSDGFYKKSGSPSKLMEFIPVALRYFITGNEINICDNIYDLAENNRVIKKYSIEEFNNTLGQHSYFHRGKLHTNLKEVLNAGILYEDVPYNDIVELKEFTVIKAMIPMFVWLEIVNDYFMVSKDIQSSLVSKNNKYWLPADFRERVYKYRLKHAYEYKSSEAQMLLDRDNPDTAKFNGTYSKLIYRKLVDEILGCSNKDQIPWIMVNGIKATECVASQEDVQAFFKELGYKQNIYTKAMGSFGYRKVIMGGWNNNFKAWKRLFIEKNEFVVPYKTQNETRLFVAAIQKIIEGNSHGFRITN